MYITILFLYLLELAPIVLCKANLQIIKKVEKFFIPLSSVDPRSFSVEEQLGAHFSLLCELVFSQNETGYDAHISWIKKSNKFNTTVDFEHLSNSSLEDFYTSVVPSELNKAEKKFDPLKMSDNGSYICFTIKFKKYVTVDVIVRSDVRVHKDRPIIFLDATFCSSTMFKCMSNGVCIISHYLCDGKADCKDGSDESTEVCNGDPCKDKLRCEDGRCIPTAWCCDKNHDVNCTVTYRPKCCQLLAETYEELEYGPPNLTAIQPSNSSAKYLFISVCILSILFSLVLLLLILSKVMIFAKKTSLQQRLRHPDLAIYHRNSLSSNDDNSLHLCHIPYDLYSYRNGVRTSNRVGEMSVFPVDDSDTVNPLLTIPGRRVDDRPPAYREVMGPQRPANFLDPPPPYTSRELLNDERNC
ncbi:hypothetical protein WA026_020528 [Henosepilachna vigintioctopunctata]|uniref:Ig-like domain-containing protein n=1 Tax=Henosepilachna vigintioctopunctata TaxID=420089 RepID=A0AAW1VF00_9CUCU